MGSTTGSIIITVKGKEVYVGTAPPSSPVDNELWLDISEKNVLKYYKASDKTWCVVNDTSKKFGEVYTHLQTNYYTKTETNNAVKEEIGKTTITKKDGTVVNMKDAINSVIDTATEHTQKIQDIDSKYNSVTGEIAKVKTSTSEIKQDLNGFKTTVSENYVDKEGYETRISSAESKIEQNADSIKNTVKKDGVISAINQSAEEIAIAAKKISLKGYVSVNTDNRKTFEIDENGNVSLDVNSLKIKAGNIEDTLYDLNDSISSANDYANEKVDELDKKISTELSNNYIDDDTFNKFKEQLSYQQNITNEGLEERFTSIDNRINNSLAGTNEKVELITKYIRHKDGKLILGEEGSTLVTTIENGMVSFTENIDSNDPRKVAYISNRKLYITDAEVHLNMILGDPDKSQFAFVPDSNGNLSFMKIS